MSILPIFLKWSGKKAASGEKRLLSKAAFILQCEEKDCLQIAHREWFGTDLSEVALATVEASYRQDGHMPPWASYFIRKVVDMDREGQLGDPMIATAHPKAMAAQPQIAHTAKMKKWYGTSKSLGRAAFVMIVGLGLLSVWVASQNTQKPDLQTMAVKNSPATLDPSEPHTAPSMLQTVAVVTPGETISEP